MFAISIFSVMYKYGFFKDEIYIKFFDVKDVRI